MRKMKSKYPIIFGLVMAVSLTIVTYLTIPMEQETYEYSSEISAQLTPWDLERVVKFSQIIAIGTVQSVETKIVDESLTSPNTYDPNQTVYTEMKLPYQYITIKVERFILDKTGKNADTITFRDWGKGTGVINGKKALITHEHMTEYKIGEKALFFMSDVNGELQSFGVVSKFNFVGNGEEVNSEFLKIQGKEPKKLTDFEAEIKSIKDNVIP